ncbi:hypothetical protein G6F59_017565 [Rhizopus arrhizus]|nr:hypothetical protein G6F59_017565 [Rhizopus arrhizus]
MAGLLALDDQQRGGSDRVQERFAVRIHIEAGVLARERVLKKLPARAAAARQHAGPLIVVSLEQPVIVAGHYLGPAEKSGEHGSGGDRDCGEANGGFHLGSPFSSYRISRRGGSAWGEL